MTKSTCSPESTARKFKRGVVPTGFHPLGGGRTRPRWRLLACLGVEVGCSRLDQHLIQVIAAPNFSGFEGPSNPVPYETFRATPERGQELTDSDSPTTCA